MSPALIALIAPLLQGLLSLLGSGPVESFLIDHALTFVSGHIHRFVRLDASWALSASVSDPASGTVTLTISRGGRTAVVLVLEPLGLTASHQATIAALVGVLFHDGEAKLLALFASVVKTAPAAAPAP